MNFSSLDRIALAGMKTTGLCMVTLAACIWWNHWTDKLVDRQQAKAAVPSRVVLWKSVEPCHADDWVCWLAWEHNRKGENHG